MYSPSSDMQSDCAFVFCERGEKVESLQKRIPPAHILVHISKQMTRWYVDLRYNSIIIPNCHNALQERMVSFNSDYLKETARQQPWHRRSARRPSMCHILAGRQCCGALLGSTAATFRQWIPSGTSKPNVARRYTSPEFL